MDVIVSNAAVQRLAVVHPFLLEIAIRTSCGGAAIGAAHGPAGRDGRGLGFPESPQQFIDKTTDSDGIRDLEEQFCDGGLHILNSNLRDVAIVKFQNLFPVSLTSLNFDATETDINYFTASASFRYTVYNITNTSGNLL